MRRTKIVATLGPATTSYESLLALVEAGVDVVRLNFSHGEPEDHRQRIETIQKAAKDADQIVAIMADMQGPKIRTGKFIDGSIELENDDKFILDLNCPLDQGCKERVGVTYKNLAQDLEPADVLLLDDGRIVLGVEKIEGQQIHTRVYNGGTLSNNKGINRRGGGLSAEALTEKDRADIKIAAELDVDYLAISFPRSAADVELARELLHQAGGEAGIIAKIERAEALECIDEIIDASDAIMIARGDLGVEIGDAELPAAQKMLINRARERDTAVITATQMMESMINAPLPTRAEVFDVANAVIDGTDAVMLSGETAVGKYPVKVVNAMAGICKSAEQQRVIDGKSHRINTKFTRTDEAVAMASMYTANHLDVEVIAALTETGATTLWMSRISSGISIYALSGIEKTLRKVKLYRGVYPSYFPVRADSHAKTNYYVVKHLMQKGVVKLDDHVIITKGDMVGDVGGTNAMKIVDVSHMPTFEE